MAQDKHFNRVIINRCIIPFMIADHPRACADFVNLAMRESEEVAWCAEHNIQLIQHVHFLTGSFDRELVVVGLFPLITPELEMAFNLACL